MFVARIQPVGKRSRYMRLATEYRIRRTAWKMGLAPAGLLPILPDGARENPAGAAYIRSEGEPAVARCSFKPPSSSISPNRPDAGQTSMPPASTFSPYDENSLRARGGEGKLLKW